MPPLLDNKNPSAKSVFAPSALLREARRQKGLATVNVPSSLRLRPGWRHSPPSQSDRPSTPRKRLGLVTTQNCIRSRSAHELWALLVVQLVRRSLC